MAREQNELWATPAAFLCALHVIGGRLWGARDCRPSRSGPTRPIKPNPGTWGPTIVTGHGAPLLAQSFAVADTFCA